MHVHGQPFRNYAPYSQVVCSLGGSSVGPSSVCLAHYAFGVRESVIVERKRPDSHFVLAVWPERCSSTDEAHFARSAWQLCHGTLGKLKLTPLDVIS